MYVETSSVERRQLAGFTEMRPSPCHLMLVHPDEAASVTDALWVRLRQEAEQAYEREPKLASLFFDSILNQPSFEAAVFHRVAVRLKNDVISLPLIACGVLKIAYDLVLWRACRRDSLEEH